jgi:hypothetical protein
MALDAFFAVRSENAADCRKKMKILPTSPVDESQNNPDSSGTSLEIPVTAKGVEPETNGSPKVKPPK